MVQLYLRQAGYFVMDATEQAPSAGNQSGVKTHKVVRRVCFSCIFRHRRLSSGWSEKGQSPTHRFTFAARPLGMTANRD
jgi:hypothetical protein